MEAMSSDAATGELKGVVCKSASGHQVCTECLQGVALMDAGQERIRELRGSVRCPWVGENVTERCSSEPWTMRELKEQLTPSTLLELMQSAIGVIDNLTAVEQQLRAKGNTSSNGAGAGSNVAPTTAAPREERLRKARLQLIERHLVLHCPRCNAAFYDYEGCDAVKCAAPGCSQHFCALCFYTADSKGVHRHIREADHHGHFDRVGYYGGIERFRAFHKQRWRSELQAAIAALSEDASFKAELMAQLEQDMEARAFGSGTGMPAFRLTRCTGELPRAGEDPVQPTYYTSICAMEEYANESPEELRAADYAKPAGGARIRPAPMTTDPHFANAAAAAAALHRAMSVSQSTVAMSLQENFQPDNEGGLISAALPRFSLQGVSPEEDRAEIFAFAFKPARTQDEIAAKASLPGHLLARTAGGWGSRPQSIVGMVSRVPGDGTLVVRYQPVPAAVVGFGSREDAASAFVSICAMPQYQQEAAEELRWADYQWRASRVRLQQSAVGAAAPGAAGAAASAGNLEDL